MRYKDEDPTQPRDKLGRYGMKGDEMRDAVITFRIPKSTRANMIEYCRRQRLTLTDLINAAAALVMFADGLAASVDGAEAAGAGSGCDMATAEAAGAVVAGIGAAPPEGGAAV